MTGQLPASSVSDDETNADIVANVSESSGLRNASPRYDKKQLALWIADGELPFFTDLGELEQRRVAIEVVRIRRQRLIEFLARQIAFSIHADRNRAAHES